MPPEHLSFTSRVSLRLGLERPARQTSADHERALAVHRKTEARLREALAVNEALLVRKDEAIRRQEVLTLECHHRLLNNLQMIADLLSLQARQEDNAEVASHLQVAVNRVQSIARLHQHLHSMDGMQSVEFKPYLAELCRDHSTMSMSNEAPCRSIAVDAIALELPTTTAIPLSLIVNELLTNAIKHGSGSVRVKLESTAAAGYSLSVSNDGPALPAGFDPLASKRLGMVLVANLVAQIGGELRIDRGDKQDCTRFAVLFT
ncbi:hypothetical protein BH11PSE3_BH11PSE3_17030 [soil metagenome]